MTNAIEQSKREMYNRLVNLNSTVGHSNLARDLFESSLEAYLELLRQDHEALHETARKRFDDLQVAEARVEEFSLALASANLNVIKVARESRDSIRKLEAVNRSYARELLYMTEARDNLLSSTSGQTSGDRVSCAKLDGKTAAILGALLDAQSVMVEYLVPDGIRAKDAIGKMIPILDNEKLYLAMRGFEHPNGGYAAWFINNTDCMHSFHPAFPGGEQCVFCGVGK